MFSVVTLDGCVGRRGGAIEGIHMSLCVCALAGPIISWLSCLLSSPSSLTAKCTPECQNGGLCLIGNQCVCPPGLGFIGKRCENG